MVHYFSIYLFGILYGVFDLESPGRNSLQSWEACIHDVSGIQSMNPVAICFFLFNVLAPLVGMFGLQGKKSYYDVATKPPPHIHLLCASLT